MHQIKSRAFTKVLQRTAGKGRCFIMEDYDIPGLVNLANTKPSEIIVLDKDNITNEKPFTWYAIGPFSYISEDGHNVMLGFDFERKKPGRLRITETGEKGIIEVITHQHTSWRKISYKESLRLCVPEKHYPFI